MKQFVKIPVKVVNGTSWGVFYKSGSGHELAAYRPKIANKDVSIVGGHRMRVVKIKDDFYWRIPEGTKLDIAGVPPASPPPRRGANP